MTFAGGTSWCSFPPMRGCQDAGYLWDQDAYLKDQRGPLQRNAGAYQCMFEQQPSSGKN